MSSPLDVVLSGLMRRYKERVPDVQLVFSVLKNSNVISNENDIENDHIAFRTLGVKNLGIQSFEKIFLHYGYQKMDHYFFSEKKLDAYWYAPPANNYPRIFMSELRVQDLPVSAQEIIYSYTKSIVTDPVDAIDLNDGIAVDEFLHRPMWRTPTLEDYKSLSNESEYAAWVIYNRYYLNHFTISVHNLKNGYNQLPEFNAFLKRHHFILNNSGGEIKTSADGLLRQSSTVAKMVEAEFAEGEKKMISGSYVEFAERLILPEFSHFPKEDITTIHRREGFEANNADKIFESTYAAQTGKLIQ